MKATDIVAEAEVEYGVLSLMDIVEETLASVTSLERIPKLLLWRTPFYDINVRFLFIVSIFGAFFEFKGD